MYKNISKEQKQMKKIVMGLLVSVIMLMAIGCGSTSSNNETNTNAVKETEDTAESVDNDAKTLIVYYSYSGTTKRVAEHLQQLTDGTLYEITLEKPYSGDSNKVSDRVFEERDDKKMPVLSGELPDISEYDQILIGTPVWNDSMSNPIVSYLEQTDFEGKTVAPFWTYITNQGSTEKDFAKRIRNAEMAEGLPVRSANGISDEKLDQMLETWLSNISVR